MKNLTLFVGLFIVCFCFSSCARKSCGGWYGNRNLDVSSIQEKIPVANDATIYAEEELPNCR